MKHLILALLIAASSAFAADTLPTFKANPSDFFYAQQTSLWVFYKVPREVILHQIQNTLDNLGFELASFEEPQFGFVIVKPMVFMAEFGSQSKLARGTSASTEVEFTVLVHQKSKNPNPGTFQDFLLGRTRSNTIGQLRLDVLCDEEVAVAAGRKLFGEHKFLGSFEYSYPTPNQNVGSTPDFSMNMTAYTFNGVGSSEKKMFSLKASLRGLRPVQSQFSPELLFSAFPSEPAAGVQQKAVGEFRYYNNQNFQAYAASGNSEVELSLGRAEGARPLSPVAPFGDNRPIAGSEKWPSDMVERMGMIKSGKVAGFLLFRSPPAEYETKPFELKN